MTDLTLFPLEPIPNAEKRGKHYTKPKGHAAPSGTGPAGETCKDCVHKEYANQGGANKFIKCGLMKAYWTRGRGSDIRASDPACRYYFKKLKLPESQSQE